MLLVCPTFASSVPRSVRSVPRMQHYSTQYTLRRCGRIQAKGWPLQAMPVENVKEKTTMIKATTSRLGKLEKTAGESNLNRGKGAGNAGYKRERLSFVRNM